MPTSTDTTEPPMSTPSAVFGTFSLSALVASFCMSMSMVV